MADNPETPNVDEAWEEIPSPEANIDEVEEPKEVEMVEGELSEPPAPVETEPKEVEAKPSDPLAPVELELKIGSQENKLPDKISKERIEASVKEKLSRKTDAPDSNPFVPQTQLENEVKEVAKSKGFPLSRGTEIGARLLARSKRRNG